jgi:Uma2 family endonuclease
MNPSTSDLHVVWDDAAILFDAELLQGSWTEEQYHRVTGTTNRLVEFVDGRIEVLPVPTDEHQVLLKWLLFAFAALVEPRGGIVQFAPLRLRLPSGRYREPDLLLLRDARDARRHNQEWQGADLVVEVISPDDRERDTVTKRREYASARIPEYWLVDPENEAVTILALDGDTYHELGVFGRGTRAPSALLKGFGVAVEDLFATVRRGRP